MMRRVQQLDYWNESVQSSNATEDPREKKWLFNCGADEMCTIVD